MNTLTEMENVLHVIKQEEKFTTKHQDLANVTTGQEDNKMDIVDQIDVPNTNVSLKVEDQLNRMLIKVNAFHVVHTQLGLDRDWMQDVSNQTAQIQLSWQDMVNVKTAQIKLA